ncbi:phosphatase PAP2 family protein [Microbacterium sp. ASV81]|uniref:Phosphatase PAP2 family protein n=1 Tax=Microbacterium capsulatum TaxID=3041921 RepID=A0ABU0XCE9_9MICO|nr:phosphatase PAP2 family protein [Microbacterium sp. ASV81]MDQ4212632.1 phosphatase PAP2 family protein [Microbacterium sp. ASV81]
MAELRRTRTRALTGIDRPARRPLVAVIVAVVGAIVVLGLGFVMKPSQADQGLVVALNTLHTGVWGSFANAVYHGIEPVPAVAITLVIAAVVWAVSRSLRTAILFGLTVALTWLPVAAVKIVVNRPRPDASLLSHPFSPLQTDGSFPSGHTAYVVALAIAFWFLLRGTRYAWAPIVFGVVATVAIGLAVVSDGLHFPTDVLGSIIWTLTTAAAVRWIVVDLIAARIAPKRRAA